jgi:uncharacterized membrane protein YeaQ/YmgE (transglycosylase-associated protein family)
MAVIAWLIVGFIAGAIARLLVPGRDRMGLLGTLVLGLAGSIVGGLVAVALTDKTMNDFTAAGLLGSILGAIAVLLVYRWLQPRGRLTGRRGARI